MEDTTGGREKAMAASSSANAKPKRELTSKTREEGELSSSDDDENIVSSVAQSRDTAAPPGRNIFANATNKYAQTAKTVSGNNLSSSVDIQSRISIQPNNQKNFEKNRVTFKPGNRGWFPTSGSNNNLVISFSDDDSGSDSENYRQENAVENKSNMTRMDGNGQPPALSVVKSNKLHQNAKNVNKLMSKKLTPNRIVSSIAKIHGGKNSKGAVHLSVEHGSRARNLIAPNKNLGSQEHGFDHGVGLRNSKLQDLRQQIALRESELKLKAAQQNKDLAVVSSRDYNAMNLSNEATRNYQSTSAAIGQLERKEPDKKRLKVSGSYSHQPTSVSHHQETPAAKLIMPVKEPTLENGTLCERNKISVQKDISVSRIESSIVKWHKHDEKRVDVLENITSAVKDDINSSGNQSDRNSKRMDHGIVVNKTAPSANVMTSSFPKNLDRMELNQPSNIGRHSPPMSFPNKATTGEQNAMKSIDYRKALSGDKIVDPSFLNIHQVNNTSLWNSGGDVNVSGCGSMDMQSILDMEELLDKELEEAQEHRRRCEIEERNALKAYHKAQRALIEANVKCTKLYHQRELCSARFRSFILDESNLLWSSRLHEPVGNGLELSNHITENMDSIPTSSHQMQPAYDGFNQQSYDSNIQCVTGGPLNVSDQHTNVQNLGSEPCSEPDASTSAPLPRKSKNLVHGLSSPSNELNASADENEETFPLEHESGQPNFEDHQKEQTSEGKQNNNINNKLSIDGSRDLLLEATLRSELFARLGMRTSKNVDSCYDVDRSVERGPDNDIGSDKMQTSNGSVPSSGAGQSQHHDSGGTDKPERSMHETPVQSDDQCHAERSSLKFQSTTNSKENEFRLRAHHSTTSALFSPPLVLRSVFGHLKVGSPVALSTSTLTGNQQNYTHNFYIGEAAFVNSNETHDWSLISSLKQEAHRGYFGSETGSYSCNFAVDPFWPLCMYELRGKCNNDECPWQHVNDFSNGNMNQHHGDSESADCQVQLTTHRQDCNGASKCRDILTPPIYLVGLDILKADSHSYESVVARRHGQCWRKCFSISLALSNMFQKELPVEFLHTSDGRIEVHEGWNRQSSYFQSRDGVMNQLKQALPNTFQSVEMALLSINQEANKLEGIKKALSILARALEANQMSEILWIIYLFIYYGNVKSDGKDDMFSHAVKHNEGSYALWLMYINSRIKLDDRLVAYDAALSALCRAASDGDEIPSACILDLVLQMLDCLCMSGNIEKAIQRISGLFPAANNSNVPHGLLLSDILTYLTISDKLILWVCCVYLVIYRKLPDAIAQRFECEKEVLAIEWPSIHLVDDEKQRVLELVETAVSFAESYIKCESLKSAIHLRSLQLFAVCHVRCMVALDGLECSWNLLDKYINLYPSCLELVLISVRLQKHDFGNLSFVGFEEALFKWPKEVPGIQCIWNQYAEHALRFGGPGFAKELMDRWFHSVWKIQYSQVESLDLMDGGISHFSQDSTSNLDFSVSSKHQVDMMFGLINLSLYRLLQTDYNEAWLTIDRALKVAGPENFKHCVREHARFLISDKSGLKEGALWQLNLLKRYLDNAPSFPNSEPLARLFINNIDKPRVRQLVTNLLSPISCDFSLVNLVLEVWYGPSLVPEMIIKLKDLVDFVESIMEIVPSNYPLAFSVCKLLIGGDYATDGTAASVLFWASSTLVSAIFHAVPIAAEFVWVEAADLLVKVTSIESISERFYKRALSVYPFSIKLWKRYYNISNTKGDVNNIIEAAKEKGIQLD